MGFYQQYRSIMYVTFRLATCLDGLQLCKVDMHFYANCNFKLEYFYSTDRYHSQCRVVNSHCLQLWFAWLVLNRGVKGLLKRSIKPNEKIAHW